MAESTETSVLVENGTPAPTGNIVRSTTGSSTSSLSKVDEVPIPFYQKGWFIVMIFVISILMVVIGIYMYEYYILNSDQMNRGANKNSTIVEGSAEASGYQPLTDDDEIL